MRSNLSLPSSGYPRVCKFDARANADAKARRNAPSKLATVANHQAHATNQQGHRCVCKAGHWRVGTEAFVSHGWAGCFKTCRLQVSTGTVLNF